MNSHSNSAHHAMRRTGAGLDRRAALKFFFSGVASALTSCSRPDEQVVPYVEMPEREVPGVPLRFASALPLAGYGRGVIVTSVEGRPIKIDGNPRHPASLGATDVFAEATVLSLYDPDRSKAPWSGGRIQSWNAFEVALQPRLQQAAAQHGAGFALLTGRVTSPTMTAQVGALLAAMPQARWYRYEPVEDDALADGVFRAFGRAAIALPRFSDTRVALLLDADPLGCGPDQVRLGHDIIAARQSHAPRDRLRLYAVEPSLSLSGALADHRLPLHPDLIGNIAMEVARAAGADLPAASLPAEADQFAKSAVADLMARRGAATVLAGPRQSADVHAVCHWINAQLDAPVDYIAPLDPVTMRHADSLRAFADDGHAGHIRTLIIIGANPVYDTPGELALSDALASIPFTAHLGLYRDETAARSTWHLPLSHVLESWSDVRAFDGTASIVQPLIRPLYDSRTAHEFLALLGNAATASSFDLVREQWRRNATGDFDTWWRQALQDGVVAGSAAPKITLPKPQLPQQLTPARTTTDFALTLAPDPAVFDGSAANNAWLQECPKPFTKEVWGNALRIAAADASELGVVDGDVLRLAAGSTAIEAPVLVQSGQEPRTIAATLGYGRSIAGIIGNGIGVDVYPLRRTDTPWLTSNVTVTPTRRNHNVLRTQHFFALEGEAAELQPRLNLADIDKGKDFDKPGAEPPTLYPPHDYDTYKWAMVIDTSACIGCNACVVACQAENNVPIVGPDEIAEGRDMHWLRIDDYVIDGRLGFSPVPCMHCEHAPCEPVCPVAASVHDSEGLNVQVYNRCVGTRFCQSNCPYKVRRFNFFGYADGEEYKGFGAEIVKAVFNPDVTVRSRGVMEKCTYCVQRISRARRAAEKDHRRIRDGEVVTACQAACPARAISFGDLSDPDARVNALRAEPHSYALLGKLGTRPRTTYLARLQNPNPNFGNGQS